MSSDEVSRASTARKSVIQRASIHHTKVDELQGVSTEGAHAMANLDLLKSDPVSFLYAWRGTATTFSFSWTLLVALSVGVVEWTPGIITAVLLKWKYGLLVDLAESTGWGAMFGANLGLSILFGFIGTFCAYIGGVGVPGSGLPELISFCACGYTMDPDFFSLKTMILKNVSMIFVLAAGICVGREGPAIAIGATTAYMVGKRLNKYIHEVVVKNPNLNQTLSQLSVGEFSKPFSGEFMHEIVHIGASAGFACAFYAPIGGALFVFEEVASHWTQHQEMTSRILFGVAVAVALSLTLSNAAQVDGHTLYESIVIYDRQHYGLDLAWQYSDAPFYILMAIYIGLQVGIMSKCAMWSSKFHASMGTMPKKMMLFVCLTIFTCLVMSAAPGMIVVCHDMPSPSYYDNVTGVRRFVRFNCPDGKYSEMASLALATSEDAIKHLFSRDNFVFSLPVLAIFSFLYTTGFTLAMGSFAAAGNFTPNVVMGSIVGRFFGHLAEMTFPGQVSAPGVYAVVGATCQLVSWTRAIPAVVVTMFEVTSDTSNLVPMLVFSMLSRSITNLFGLDGWAHSVFHENGSLPKHRVRPVHWKNNETLTNEDRVVLDYGHSHGDGYSHQDGPTSSAGRGNDKASGSRLSLVDGQMTIIHNSHLPSPHLDAVTENPVHYNEKL